MNFNFTINSDASELYTLTKIRELNEKHRYLKISVKTGRARSQLQNQVTHVWYQQLAAELPEEDALGWKCFCKLFFGVPILRAEDDDFRELYDLTIKRNLTYEEKLKAMKYMPVTSQMNKEQIGKYQVAMQEHFRIKGVLLEFLDK